jgi:hypothetical protein
VAPKREVNIVLKAKDEASKVFENVANNALPQFAKRVAQALTAFASVAAVEETLRHAVTAALEAEKATAGLAAALKAQGATAVDSLPGLKAHAEALSRVALADDEAIQGAQRVLVSIGGLLGPKLDDATQAALDLSAGLGIDLEQAATMVAKAAQGSTREFSRLGFEFAKNATDGQKLDAVLAGIQSRFGGMAAHELTTASGKLHEFREAFGELLETLGTKLISGTDNVGGLTKAMQALNDEANKPGGVGFWNTLVTILAGKVGIGGGLADIETHLKLLAEHSAKLAENMAEDRLENPAIGYKDAVAQARAELKASADWAAELEKRTQAAKKAAEQLAEVVAKFNANTAVQTFDPQQRTPKTPITGATEGIVLKGLVDAASGPSEKDLAAAAAINEQIDAVITLSKAVGTVEEAWAAVASVQQAIGDATPEQAAALIAMGNALIANAKVAQETTANTQIALDALTQAATELGSTFVDAAFGAKVSWSDAIEEILKGIAKAIVQALILKLIQAIFTGATGGAGAAVGAGVSLGAGAVGVARGGIVGSDGVVYAASGLFTPRGTDVFPAMLSEGETVLNRGVSQKIFGGQASLVPTGAGGGRTVNLYVQAMDGPSFSRFLTQNPRALREALDHLEARGL